MFRCPHARTDRHDSASAGFTLVELMVAISILGVVSTAVTALIMMSLRTAHETKLRVGDSNAAALTSTFFRRDVESAEQVTVTREAQCAPNAQLVVKLTGVNAKDMQDPGETVEYVLTEGGRTLMRLTCRTGPPESELVVAEGLDPDVAPTIRCETRRDDPAPACGDNSKGLVTLTLALAGSPRQPKAPAAIPIIASRRTT